MVDPSAAASSARRRMQKHRESVKYNVMHLQADIKRLEEKRKLLVEATTRPRTRRPFELATEVLLSHSRGLRSKVEERLRVIRAIQTWVSMQRPRSDLFSHASWIDSTLVADPVCRQQGYRWLTERAYHVAMKSHPRDTFDVEDQVVIDVLTSAADPASDPALWRDQPSGVIEGACTRMQFTVFASLDVAAAFFWQMCTHPIPTSPMVEWADESRDLVYFQSYNPVRGTTTQAIVRRFRPSPHQVAFIIVNVAVDENVPLKKGQMRTHGMCSLFVDEVSPGVALVRSIDLALTPLTCHGMASLDVMGVLLDMGPRSVADSPKLYFERIRSVSTSQREVELRHGIKMTNHFMEQLEAGQTQPKNVN